MISNPISKQFLSYTETPGFKAELMDLALVGDAVILMYIRNVGYQRLRFTSPQHHSEFDGRFKSNDLFIRFCREHNLFPGTSGKTSADYLEAYWGWLHVKHRQGQLDRALNDYFLWYLGTMKTNPVRMSCPLLRQRFPLFFV